MSAEQEMYTQCRLVKATDDPPGQLVETAWIPSGLARVGKWLRVYDEEGWKVEAVYSQRTWADLKQHERDYCIQRRASDA